MPRIQQNSAHKGSQWWLQYLVNRNSKLLDGPIRDHLRLEDSETIDWLSPLIEDDYAEYQDDDFLTRLSLRLDKRSLRSFWPRGGPVWDGLGRTSRGDILLVEAKSHVAEMNSSCQASLRSLNLIRDSMAVTAAHYGLCGSPGWTDGYYQYANRLSHLYLLRGLNGIPAWLLFLYFVNDAGMAGPKTVAEWCSAIDSVHKHLGVAKQQLEPYVIDIFIDTAVVAKAEKWLKR